MKIEFYEMYKEIEISKYIYSDKVEFGVFQDLTEYFVHPEYEDDISNHAILSFLREYHPNIIEIENLEFDSEADNFAMYSKNIDTIKLVIDIILSTKQS